MPVAVTNGQMTAWAKSIGLQFIARLKKARDPAALDKALADMHSFMDETFQRGLLGSGRWIACKENCSFCCYIKVDVRAPEVFRIVNYLRAHYSEQEVAGVRERAREYAEKLKVMTHEQQMVTNLACPLLRDGRCMAYNVRPSGCRKHHAQNVAGCEAAFKDPKTIVPSDTLPHIQVPLSALSVVTGIAYQRAGLDATPYDLAPALHECLENPKSAKRWRDGKRAFSRAAIIKDFYPQMLATLASKLGI